LEDLTTILQYLSISAKLYTPAAQVHQTTKKINLLRGDWCDLKWINLLMEPWAGTEKCSCYIYIHIYIHLCMCALCTQECLDHFASHMIPPLSPLRLEIGGWHVRWGAQCPQCSPKGYEWATILKDLKGRETKTRMMGRICLNIMTKDKIFISASFLKSFRSSEQVRNTCPFPRIRHSPFKLHRPSLENRSTSMASHRGPAARPPRLCLKRRWAEKKTFWCNGGMGEWGEFDDC
jgi:hypothetical protein